MAELRSVDPRTLKLNPDNPRRTAIPKEMDAQLVASIKAIGLLQPPVAREIDGKLVVRAGDRRTKAAISAGLKQIDVYVLDGDDAIDPMAAMSENLVRVSMNPVDTWRGVQRLETQGWNEEAIAGALALPARAIRKLKLLGSLHPPMLDVMAKGSMPNEEQLRTIAHAPLADQAEVWKAHKPKKAHDVVWWEVARALSKHRIPFAAARFDAATAEDYGVVWEDDLFAPAGEDGRYTTNVEAFFAAQQAFMAANLPKNGTVLILTEYGQPSLPKGAERVWGKPGKEDVVGHYVDPRTGAIETVAYRLPPPKKATAKPGKGGDQAPTAPDAGETDSEVVVKLRPDVTQRGQAMIGDFRTDALHQGLDNESIPHETLVGLLVLALAGRNVTIQSTDPYGFQKRETIRDGITEGGVLTADHAAIHAAARAMLKHVLSCRANMTDSGISARIAGEALGASDLLPSMATEEFLTCLSRQALERSAAAEGVRVEIRVKDTRAALITHCKAATWRFPGALFALTPEERANVSRPRHWVGAGAGDSGSEDADDAGDLSPEDGGDADDTSTFQDAAD